MSAVFDGVRFPRSMLNGPANERLLTMLGVEIIDDGEAEYEDYARAWLATAKRGNAESAAAIRRVRAVLERLDKRRAA